MRSSTLLRLMTGTLLLSATTSCGSNESDILVSVSGITPRITKLSVKATLDGKAAMAPVEITSPLDRFGINLPNTVGGHLILDIQALDSDGCLQGTGQTTSDLPNTRADISLSLTPQSPRKCGAFSCAAGTICGLTTVQKPDIPSSTNLWGMWASSPTDIWAVGDAATAIHFDGAVWRDTFVPSAGYLNSVWGSGSNDVWAVGVTGTIVHWQDKVWSTSPSGANYDLNGVWGVGPKDVWAVGSASAGTPSQGEFWHWDGTSWKIVVTGIVGKLYGVWASSPSDIYACGVGGLLMHYNGSSWGAISTGVTQDLRFLWGAGANSQLFAVGVLGTILRTDATGMGWKKVANTGTATTLYAVVGDGTSVYAVGNAGSGTSNFLKGGAPYDAFPAVSTGSTADMTSVVVTSNGMGWVAGKSAYLGYFDTRP